MFVVIYDYRFEYPEINDSDLRCVDPQTISKVFRDVRNLQLRHTSHLCPHQTQRLFISLSRPSRLSHLNMESLDLQHLAPNSLAQLSQVSQHSMLLGAK